jgi:putative membrane protein
MELWFKALHLVSMVTWFAAIFYLPRLFVYHSMIDATEEPKANERFKVMERKLLKGIMTPSMLGTLIFGFAMLFSYAAKAYGGMAWIWIKLALVLLLIIYHFYCAKIVKQFANDANQKSHTWYRYFNEVPVIILLLIIWLAVFKPF